MRRALPSTLPRPLYLVVAAASVAQAATVLVTRDLWRSRITPPNLPVGSWASGLGSVDWAPVLVVLCLVTLVVPRWGGPAAGGAVVLAVLGDQTRLQPEVVSLAAMMIAPAFGTGGVVLARWHLATLWLWAGIHKFLSLNWGTDGAGTIAGFLDRPGQRATVAIVLPAFEVLVGLAACWTRTWPVLRWAGAALHLGILLTLSPVFGDWNSAVWPWNVALAVASVVLFSPRLEPASMLPSATALRVAVAAIVVYPALFYVGITDHYLAHNLYSANGSSAEICQLRRQRCEPAPYDTWDRLNVPFPPEERLFRKWFRMRCQTGTELVVTGPRTRLTDPPEVSRFRC